MDYDTALQRIRDMAAAQKTIAKSSTYATEALDHFYVSFCGHELLTWLHELDPDGCECGSCIQDRERIEEIKRNWRESYQPKE